MKETRYIVEEEYPDGHDMGYNSYGPTTEAELLRQLVPDHMPPEDFQYLMGHGELEPVHSIDGSSFRLVPVRDHAVVVTWSEPQDGVSVYGPYTWAEAEAAMPKIEPHFVQCTDMGFEWGGVIPDDVIFDITQLEKP